MKYLFSICFFMLTACFAVCAQETPKTQLDSALVLMKENKQKQAKSLFLKAIAAYRQNNNLGADYATCLHQLAICLSGEDVSLAMQYAKQAMDLRKKLFGILNEDYITSYSNVGVFYRIMKQYDEALKIHREVLDLSLKLSPIHKNTAMYAQNIGLDYELAGDKKNALIAYEKALTYYEKFSDSYGALLEKLAMEYYDLNDEQKFMYYMELIDEHNKHELEKECNEPECMMERAAYYASVNNLTEAKKCYLKAIALSKTPEEKMATHGGYALFLFNNKNYEEAKNYFQSLCSDYEQHQLKTEIHANAIRTLALSFYFLREYESAINEFKRYQALYDELGLEKTNLYYTSLSTLASAYYLKQDYQNALNIYDHLKTVYKACNDSVGYADALRHIADVYVRMKNYQEAVVLYEESIKIYKDTGNDAKLNQAMSDLNICCIKGGIAYDSTSAKQQRKKMIQKLLDENVNNLAIYKKVFGEDDLLYVQTLGNMAEQYMMLGEKDKAVEFYTLFVPAQRMAIKNIFRTLNATERALVWNEYSDVQDSLMSMALLLSEKGVMAGLAYDVQLLSKGILLNSSIEFEQVLRSTGDAEIMSVYEQIKANTNQMMEIKSSGQGLDSLLLLKQRNDRLETVLMERCAEYKDYTDYLSYSWRDIQKELKHTDVAIEFAEVKNGLTDGEHTVVAILLGRDFREPVMIPVCQRNQLQKIIDASDTYDNLEYGHCVWKNILPYLKNKKRVFFSADVELQVLGIEYLTVGRKPMFELYDMYRLSSTKELCKSKRFSEKKNIALWGGVDYSAEETLDAEESEAAENILAMQHESGFRFYDGTFDFGLLPYSLEEVDHIRDLVSKSSAFNIIQYAVGTNAGKHNFQSLDSKKINVLHLSTHGVCQVTDGKQGVDPMDNSFLVLAGANTLSVVPEDAVVTAREIAQMNLRECELVILSACESGLGKLDKDGVFGLQRGFKNAGVSSLIMSLKKVYDQQSAEMMVLFYKNWIKYESKHRAFVKTLQELRKQGWTGEHWACFILLDALDW